MFAIVDIETCGSKFEFRRGRITDICIVVHDGLQVVDKFSSLINPECPITYFYTKLTGITNQSKTVLIFINQIREKIGVMFGSPETTTGGRALKFYASIRLDVRRVSDIKDGDRIIGHTMKAKGVKNKVGTPKKETLLDLYYPGESDIVGFDKMGDLVNYGTANGVVDKSGAWYAYGNERIGQGLANASAFLRANPKMAAKIVAQIKAVREKK